MGCAPGEQRRACGCAQRGRVELRVAQPLLGEAVEVIRRGAAEVMVTGGTESGDLVALTTRSASRPTVITCSAAKKINNVFAARRKSR